MATGEQGSAPSVPVLVGTAGHIDHGKSALVRALTGTDPDRWAEEKRRGITLDLGFAFLDERIALIDVPGHERFVKHMVAGAATVDLAMLVVAADDGVMPQTEEHLDVLDLLGVHGGLVVLNKADLVDDEWLALVREQVEERVRGTVLEGAPILAADALSGRGVPEVAATIRALAAGKRSVPVAEPFRMPVDRVFTMRGFGTVVTGSALAGRVAVDDRLLLMPAGREVRVRGVQSQWRTLPQGIAGQRLAVNVVGVAVDDVTRGDVLAAPGAVVATDRLVVRLRALPRAPVPLADRQRVRVHLGTADRLGRLRLLAEGVVAPGAEGLALVRLEQPVAARRGERFVLRRYSPLATLGGGVVLDADPPRRRLGRAAWHDLAARLDAGDAPRVLAAAAAAEPFAPAERLFQRAGLPEDEAPGALDDALGAGLLVALAAGTERRFVTPERVGAALDEAVAAVRAFHEAQPLRAGMPRQDLASRLARGLPRDTAPLLVEHALAMGALVAVGPAHLRAPGFEVTLTRRQREQVEALRRVLSETGLEPPGRDELAARAGVDPKGLKTFLALLADQGEILTLDEGMIVGTQHLEPARAALVALFARTPDATVADIRDALRTTRRVLIPLLAWMDGRRWTVREGDLRRAGPAL